MTTTSNGSECNNGASCCCDVCTQHHVGCDGSCCRCVPNILCATFTPDDEETCRPFGLFMPDTGNGTYQGTLFGDSNIVLFVEIFQDPYTRQCQWVVSIPYYDFQETHDIDRVYTTCTAPLFQFRLEIPYCPGEIVIQPYELARVPFVHTGETGITDCVSSVTYIWDYGCDGGCTYHSTNPLPGVWVWTLDNPGTCVGSCSCDYPDEHPTGPGQTASSGCTDGQPARWRILSESDSDCECTPTAPTEDGTVIGETQVVECTGVKTGTLFQHSCGACSEVCASICIRYDFEGESVRKTFRWDGVNQRYEWHYDDTYDYIYFEENYDGECQIRLDITDFDPEVYDFDPYVLENCAVGLDIEIGTNSYSPGYMLVKLSCNPCSCWKHVCAGCRCTCNQLCVILYDNGEATLYEPVWDGTINSWVDGDFVVLLNADPDTDQCLITVPGFEAVPVDGCGIDIQFALNDPYTGEFAGFIRCKTCICQLSPRVCCDGTNLEDLPLVLTATLTAGSGCSCAGSVTYLYYNPFDSSWRGRGSLGGCYSESSFDIMAFCNVDRVTFEIGNVRCGSNGVGGPIFYLNLSGLETSYSCNPIETTVINFTVDRSCCDDEPMAGGTFNITLTE